MVQSNSEIQSNQEHPKPVIKRKLTDQEKKAIAKVKQRGDVNHGPIFRTTQVDGNEKLELVMDEQLERREAIDLLDSRVMEFTGSANRTVALQLLTNVAKAIVPVKAKGEELAKQIDSIALSMQALAPQDEYEGQLVAQLIVLHDHSMDWLGRAIRTERMDFANIYLNGASKLLARHHETLEALMKYRRNGEQRVHVEHVHVYGGAQAIVGNVTTGGGDEPKI